MSWSARQYVAFEGERTRPVRDLLSAVPRTDARAVVDLGCGPGNSTEALAARFPGAVTTGLDNSADMIEAAHLRLAELATLVEWGDLHGLEVAIKLASADTEGEMAFIGYGEGIATWTVYWIEGLMWLAFLPDPSGQGFEGWKVRVESLDEAMSWIIAETEK